MKSQGKPMHEAAPETAEGWVARLSSPQWSEADSEAFEAWRALADNDGAFVRAERLHESTRVLSSDPLIRAAAAAARRKAPAGQARRVRPVVWLSAAASIAVAVLAATLRTPVVEPLHYASQVGERREIRLDDGTRALLDTDSEIAVRYSAQRREMTVVRGRVDIDVAQQPGRPFVTLAANGTINDIGTRFQVERAGSDVTVTLLQGEVSVDTAGSAPPTVLAPGTLARYGASGDIARASADLDAANGWTRGELVFKSRPLADLVNEMNRYSTTRIRLAERSLDGILVSGVFHAGNQDALIKALESGWSLRAERPSGKEIVLRAPQRR